MKAVKHHQINICWLHCIEVHVHGRLYKCMRKTHFSVVYALLHNTDHKLKGNGVNVVVGQYCQLQIMAINISACQVSFTSLRDM